MTAADFRRIAVNMQGVEEHSQIRLPTFSVAGRKFASLASQANGYGNLVLTLEQQARLLSQKNPTFYWPFRETPNQNTSPVQRGERRATISTNGPSLEWLAKCYAIVN